MRGYREKCGCRADLSEWIVLCPEHQKEVSEVHERWAQEYKDSMAKFDAMKVKEEKKS